MRLRLWIGLLTLMAALLGSAPACAQATGPGAYTIGGIDVDVVAKTPDDARMTAYREAQRKAWPLLWARLTGEPAPNAPHLADGAIEAMVAGIEVQGERFSMTRYIGRLGVVFDRSRAAAYLGDAAGMQAPPPMLLLPVTIDGGARTVYQVKTPWVAAWQRFREAASALDYVLVTGNSGDNVMLTAYQARRGDRPLWRNILNRYKASDVLVAEAKIDRSYPGGPIAATFIARHGPDAVELGRVGLRTNNAAGLEAMLDEGARQVDAIYVKALREGRLRGEPGLITELEPLMSGSPDIGGPSDIPGSGVGGGIEAMVATPDAKSWAEIEALLRGTPTVSGVSLTSLSLGGTSRIVIRHAEGADMLAYRLDQRGLRLAPVDGGILLRRKLATDAPIAPPPSLADLNAAESVGEPDATAATPGAALAKPSDDVAPVRAAKPVPDKRPSSPSPSPSSSPAAGAPVDLLPPAKP